MASFESRRFVVISTGHVTAATARLLDETPSPQWPCVGGCYGTFGWFLCVHEQNGLGADAIPEDLFAAMTWARGEGFDYLLLDCDGDLVDGLPSYAW